MSATRFLAHHAVAEKVRNVLSACRYIFTPRDYARRVVGTVATVTQSQYAVWLNWPAGPESLVAETEGFAWQARVLSLCEGVPRLSNDLEPGDGVYSIAAAPVMFRSSITGVLAVANGAILYTPADLQFLEAIGRAAVLEHESLERAETLGLANPRQRDVDLVHGLRQPLGILEACTYYLELILAAGEDRARDQLAEMQTQLVRASSILDKSLQGHAPCFSGPGLAETEAAETASRFLTNSAMSMVT
jgi:GAF domain-containing protein